MAETNVKEINFEVSMKRLSDIVEKLEAGDLALEDSLKLYEEGVKLSQGCMKRLTEAQQRIETLMRGSGGELSAEETDEETLKTKPKKSKNK